jgi:hypothetical protein
MKLQSPIVNHLAVRLRLRFRGEVVAYLLRAFRKESRQVWAPEAPGDPHLMLVAAITARITSAGIAHGRPLRARSVRRVHAPPFARVAAMGVK